MPFARQRAALVYIYLLYLGKLKPSEKSKNFLKKVLTKFESHAIMAKLSSTSVAAWFSRLERRPVTPEVEGSSPFAVAIHAPNIGA